MYMENRFSKLSESGNLLIIPMKHEIAFGMLSRRLGRKLLGLIIPELSTSSTQRLNVNLRLQAIINTEN